MPRLGKNLGAYKGDTINIDEVLADVEKAAASTGWRAEWLPVSERLRLLTLERGPADAAQNIYISTGLHGDEPAGPSAVRQLMLERAWPDSFRLWLSPCLNPEGFRRNTRENEDGIDLNRDYLHLQTAAVRAHVNWLRRLPRFDLSLCLHEDWEAEGFYLYEANADGSRSLAEPLLEAVAKVCPIDPSPLIEGRPAEKGIIRPNLDPASRPQWPEALFLLQHKTNLSYTLEAPSDFPLSIRVAALATAVRTAVAAL